MLSYQHSYHAGNHADILKHFVLSYVMEYLNKKEKPYTFFDTHSASGVFDLLDNKSLKTLEAQNGILKLINQNDLPQQLDVYLNVVKENLKNNIYFGSPKIEEHFIRPQDFLILSELHPTEFQNLKNNFYKTTKNVQIHNRNGWEMIKALTPPKTKRGAVLIDPSYEQKEDYEIAAKTISFINKKWSNGIILLWYPLLKYRQDDINLMIQSICNDVKENNQNTEIVNLQLCIADKDSHTEVELAENAEVNKIPRLYGSGMLVINAPYLLKENTEPVIKYLESILKMES
ncbi:MAG: 23S rRNA (adenine(2030)-N(6))-methyltransferase RlmJ [Treponema sp.]|nr:23S rRNA (adenine(2030)-N(6))-methyltransferase RlmJ [Treponema sp.]